MRGFLSVTLSVALSATLLAPAALAQDKYPSRPITFIVGYAAGGGGEVVARLVADFAREKHGTVINVEFKPGAGATIAADQLARSKPDGYTVSGFSGNPLFAAPHMQKVPYDPLKSFTYLVTYFGISNAAYVRADSPFKSFTDLVAYAKSNPGKLRWSTAAPRGTSHIATEAAFRSAGAQTTFVPFNGGAEAMAALLGKHIDLSVSSDYGPYLNSGDVRLLAETGSVKIPGMPEVPTYADLGYPISITTTYGVFGPAGLSAEVIAWWEGLIKELMAAPIYETTAKRMRLTPFYEDSATLTRSVQEGYARFGEAIQSQGLNAAK